MQTIIGLFYFSFLAVFKGSHQKGMQMKNYEGGTNPLLVFLLIALCIFAGIVLVIYFLWNLYKKFKFTKICQNTNLTGEEIGVLKSFITRFEIAQPLLILIRRNYFDNLSSLVAHHYGHKEISEDDLLYEMEIFNTIRKKLGLTHSFKKKYINSSRALPVNLPIVVTYFDKSTDNKLVFNSSVIANDDLFLSIAPPKDEELLKHLRETKKPQLEISFIRERDAEYHFESTIYRFLKTPEELFHLQHADRITRGNVQKPLEIPASIIYHSKDGVEEHEAIVELLDSHFCTFYLKDQEIHLHKTAGALINMTVKDKNLALQSTITRLVKRGERLFHRAELKNLNENVSRFLLQFAFGRKKQENNS